MNLEQLQQQFGIPNRVRFAEGRGGMTRVDLQHPSGARVEVYLHGAHVTSWQTARGREVLFVSRASHFQDGAPIRGGIPVIFPQFGAGPLPKHGLARIRAWAVARTALGADGTDKKAVLCFGLYSINYPCLSVFIRGKKRFVSFVQFWTCVTGTT